MLYPNRVGCMMYTCAIMETVCDMRTIINHLASLCLMMRLTMSYILPPTTYTTYTPYTGRGILFEVAA